MGHTDTAVPTVNEFVKLHQDTHPTNPILRHDAPHTASVPGTAEYADFSATLRRELAPATILEDVIVDRVILAAWRLQVLSLEESLLAHDGKALAPIRQETLRVECSLETSLMLLDASRRARPTSWGHAQKIDTRFVEQADTEFSEESEPFSQADYSNEWVTLPEVDSDEVDTQDVTEETVERVRWEDRLTFDENISQTSPVVTGTWVTANQVVSRIVDGWSWSDVLRSYPELTECDIRACLAYTVDQDGIDSY